MRLKRTAIAAAVLLLGAAACAAFLPSVQTWAVRRYLARGGGRAASVGRVSAGLGGVRLEGLRIELSDGVFLAPLVDADFGVLPLLAGKGPRVSRLVARGWTLDLSGPRAAVGAESANAAVTRSLGGVLSAFNLRANLSLDNVELDGDVVLPDEAGRPAARVHAHLSGGGLGAGRQGRFVCRCSAVSDDPASPVSSVEAEGALTAATGPSGAITRAEITADAKAIGRDFPSGIGLSFAGVALRSGSGASYSLALSRGGERIAEVEAKGGAGTPELEGSWRLDLRDTDLAPFALGRRLPEFHASGRGDYQVVMATGDLHATGKLEVSADRLGVVARSLGPLGRVGLSADFDVAGSGSLVRVSRLDTSLSGLETALSVKALQPFEFDAATGELKVAVPTGDLVGISLKGVPVAWIQGLAPGFSFSGSPIQGELVMRAEDGRLALRTRAPVRTTGLSVSRLGRPLAQGLELSAFVLADYAPQGWQVQLAPLALRRDAARIFSLEARFGHLEGAGRATKAAGSWSASLPALLSMPGASDLPMLASGEASGSFEASLDSTREYRVKFALANLASASDPDARLPAVTSELRADFGPAGRVSFDVPLRMDFGGRVSTVSVSGEVREGPQGPSIDGTVATGRLTGEDLAVLSALLGPRSRPAGPPGEGPAPAPPAWPGWRGHLVARLDGLSLPRAELSDVQAVLDVEPSAVAVSGGSARLWASSRASFSGRVNYLPAAERPFMVRADVALTDIDSTQVFTELEPGRPPAVEGRFDVTTHLSGEVNGAGDLLERLQGDLALSSKGGVFRALRTNVTDQVRQEQSRLAGALDTVSAFFGRKSDKLGTSLVEAVKGLSEIHYDQMSVSVERGGDLDLRISEIALIAPDERLTGKGRITHQEGVDIADQPLSLDLDLGVRGKLEGYMDAVGLLGDTQDELGYTHLYQAIHLGGSLRSIDRSQWKDTLIQAPLRKGGGLFDKLLGR